jgi:hypothetical protein
MSKEILSTINESMHLNRLQGATADTVKNAFFANYLGALILLRLQDFHGLMLINDPGHSKLTRFSQKMSDLNFWGRAMFYPNEREVKSRLAFGHDKILAVEAGRVMDARIQKMMKVPLTNPEMIDWNDTIGAMLLLKHRFSLNSSYFNNIVYALHKWDSASDTVKKRAINQAFMYLMQSDPKSGIMPRLRALSSKSMITGIANIAQKIIGFKKINEDEGGGAGTSVGGIATGDNAIVSGKSMISQPEFQPAKNNQDMENVMAGMYKLKKKAPYQVTKKGKYIFNNGKIIKKKTPVFKARKFKAPDFLHARKKVGDGDVETNAS